MDKSLTEAGSLYSQKVGFVYVFNLIVGTGALTMPRAFASAGWLISTIGVTVLAFMSYLTLTFVIEAMGAANAILKVKSVTENNPATNKTDTEENEHEPLLNDDSGAAENIPPSYGTNSNSYTNSPAEPEKNVAGSHLSVITQRVEMGQMASIFYPHKLLVLIFYIVLCIYLYGDLAIYAAAVPKSIRDVACTHSGIPLVNVTDNSTAHCNTNLTDNDLCWTGIPSINRLNAYRIFLALFILLLGPFIFFDAQKTKHLQLFTTFMRWLSFSIMITLAVIRLSKGQGEGHPPIANFTELPTLFGVCVYSFMCHHSLPSMVTPIKDKGHLYSLFAGDYVLILVFYSVLSFTGIFTFSHLQDLYTLNFFCDDSINPVTNIAFIQYFLALFPVFTLSTNFPIIGVTLRNNLRTMAHLFRDSFPLERFIFPLIAILPPFLIALGTSNVEFLVSITGSYAGAGIQYMIPVGLVFYSRKAFKQTFGEDTMNMHRSPFKHTAWLLMVVVWFIVCVVLVTVHHIVSKSIS